MFGWAERKKWVIGNGQSSCAIFELSTDRQGSPSRVKNKNIFFVLGWLVIVFRFPLHTANKSDRGFNDDNQLFKPNISTSV